MSKQNLKSMIPSKQLTKKDKEEIGRILEKMYYNEKQRNLNKKEDYEYRYLYENSAYYVTYLRTPLRSVRSFSRWKIYP